MAGQKNLFFELGFLKVKDNNGTHSLACEEITVTVSTDNNARYVCDIITPVDIQPTKKKFSFQIKKPKFFESDLLFVNSVYGGNLTLDLYRLINGNDLTETASQNKHSRELIQKTAMRGAPGAKVTQSSSFGASGTDQVNIEGFIVEHVLTLNNCAIDSSSFGNFDGTKPISEDIQGIAKNVEFSDNVAGYYKKSIEGDEL